MTNWAAILVFGVTAIWAALLAAVAYLVAHGPRGGREPAPVVNAAPRA